MDKVIPLHGTSTLSNIPVPSVVQYLEKLLERAKRGEINAIAYAGVEPGGKVFYNHEFGTARLDSLVASVAALDTSIKASWMSGYTDRPV